MANLYPSSQHYSVSPRCHVIAVLVNEFDTESGIESDGLMSLRKVAKLQTVLIARKGMGEHSIAPIFLNSLSGNKGN